MGCTHPTLVTLTLADQVYGKSRDEIQCK
jgi:hypothetical protein